jgi:hypothetical protein
LIFHYSDVKKAIEARAFWQVEENSTGLTRLLPGAQRLAPGIINNK